MPTHAHGKKKQSKSTNAPMSIRSWRAPCIGCEKKKPPSLSRRRLLCLDDHACETASAAKPTGLETIKSKE